MKAMKAQVEQRVAEVLRLRLAGASFADMREYARAQQWNVSDGQLWRYVARSDRALTAALEKDRRTLLARHLAQRRLVYAKAMEAGAYGHALACLKDEAELERLYDTADLEQRVRALEAAAAARRGKP